jgi:hypothetical protein
MAKTKTVEVDSEACVCCRGINDLVRVTPFWEPSPDCHNPDGTVTLCQSCIRTVQSFVELPLLAPLSLRR